MALLQDWIKTLAGWVKTYPWIAFGIGVFLLSLSAASGGAAVFAAYNWDRIEQRFLADANEVDPNQDTRLFAWDRRSTALHEIDVAEVDIGSVGKGTMGGGIDTLDDLVIFVTPTGWIGHIDLTTGALSYAEVRVPMDYDRLRNEVFWDKAQFVTRMYRVQDIMIRTDTEERTHLYVSHHQMKPNDEDICQVISRIELDKDSEGLKFDPSGWELFYTVQNCINLPAQNWQFIGDLSGGRMLHQTETQILYSVGTSSHARGTADLARIRSPESDYGKILLLDTLSGEREIYARGFRNPQGLTKDHEGRLWETEHGPMGGDEINLIQKGKDYGWPLVTYGTDYGRRDWPHAEDRGRHDGFEQPILSFLPSIAPSQLVSVPLDAEFDLWRGDLLIGSLKQQTLYRARILENRVVTLEPMEMQHRLRDMTWLKNGWLAILTDSEKILFVRAADIGEKETDALLISGFSDIYRTEQENRAAMLRSEAWFGKEIFNVYCSTCHNLDGTPGPAPDLGGIIGAEIGRDPEYPYSEALSNAGGRWTESRLKSFVKNPDAMFSGTSMNGIELKKWDERALIDYLKSTPAN